MGRGRPQSADTAAKKLRVVELRDQAWKFDDIGRELGMSGSYAQRLYYDALRDIPAEKVVESRARACRIADDTERELLELARDDANTTRTRVDAYVAIKGWEEHRAKLLGTYAPVKSQVSVITEDHVDAAIRELEAKLAGNDPTETSAEVEVDDDVDARADT